MSDLGRFVKEQERVFEQVRRELRDGRKAVERLEAQRNGPALRVSLCRREAYLKHSFLKPRLIRCIELLTEVEGRSINDIFGNPDDLKFIRA